MRLLGKRPKLYTSFFKCAEDSMGKTNTNSCFHLDNAVNLTLFKSAKDSKRKMDD